MGIRIDPMKKGTIHPS